MKKLIIALVAIIVIGGGAAALVANNKNDSAGDKKQTAGANKTENAETKQTKGKAACELLTLEDAKTLIGASAVLADGSAQTDMATTESVDVDNCTYSADGATLGDFMQITIQRHFGDKSQVRQAYENYQKEYPGEALSGLGERAYVATEGRQVQVLSGDYWLFVAGGSINAGDAANQELAVKAARLALEKL